jgi:hypothetical protein
MYYKISKKCLQINLIRLLIIGLVYNKAYFFVKSFLFLPKFHLLMQYLILL